MNNSWSLIAELESAVSSGNSEKRVDILRRVTSLFLDDADRLNDEQVSVFDNVLVHLVGRIEARALAQLSNTLAPVQNAPVQTIRTLAFDDRIAIAGPVIAQSPRLTEVDLLEIANTKSDDHLLAMSARPKLSVAVTDVLVDRGSARVMHRLTENVGAQFSNSAFTMLVNKGERDPQLAVKLGFRLDLPIQLLRQLLQRATELVRTKLLSGAPPERRTQIEDALTAIAAEICREVTRTYNFSSAEDLVKTLNRDGKLNEQVLLGFVSERRHEETIATLALFCGAAPSMINKAMKSQNFDGLLVACKAAKLSWSTVSAILRTRFAHYSVSENELDEARRAFIALSQTSAQRTMRFMLIQEHGKEAC
jgi:uncharacterized protein (DUF2336 family)